MQFLIDFAAEDSEFQKILARATEYPIVQGVVLDIDRLWLWLWACKERRYGYGLRYLRRYLDRDWFFQGSRGHNFGPELLVAPLTRKDVEDWRPDDWEWLMELREEPPKRLPLVVKICLRPRATPDEVIPTARDLYEPDGKLKVEIEVRARAQLASNPRLAYAPLPGGVSIGMGATDYGTLGIILTNASGQRYGLTCSHVTNGARKVRQPAQRDSKTGSIIGTSILSSTLTPCGQGSKCNPWSGIVANEIDASLIEIDAQAVSALLEVLDIGPLSGIMGRASLSTSQPVEVVGRTSSLNSLQVGGLAAWYSFTHGASDYCFKNLFEVESPYATGGIIRLGDSGAPVCAPGASGTEWAGMIAGQDAFKGYAIYAQTLEQWLSNHGYALTVL